FVATGFDREPELGADAVGAGHEYRFTVAGGQFEQCAEAAEPGEDAGSFRARGGGLDAVNERVARVDVDAGIAVGEGRFVGHGSRRSDESFVAATAHRAGRKGVILYMTARAATRQSVPTDSDNARHQERAASP